MLSSAACALVRPRRVPIGRPCTITLALENGGRRPQALVVDLAIHFVKANGATRSKVFKVAELRLGPREKATAAKTISFAQRTTRRHYPGRHRLEALVNGRAVPVGHVDIVGR